MLYKSKIIFPKVSCLSLYAFPPNFNIFCKTSRFNFWFYSAALEENYYLLSDSCLLFIQHKSTSNAFFSVQRILACALKSSVFKWRFHFQITGLGFKLVHVDKAFIEFSLGFSHSVVYYLKENVFALQTAKQKQSFKIFGLDLSAVVLLAGTLKRLKSPDIYKGKGFRFYKEKLKLRKRKKFSR